ncbi:MAG: diadenylate cyclase [Clostridiales bacterium]|nr:diadenylate cyclase [Clostridiales bacterium]
MVVDKIIAFWNNTIASPELAIMVGVSLAAFTVMYYYLIKFLINNNSGTLVLMFLAIMVIAAAIFIFNDGVDNGFFLLLPLLMVIAVIILYSVEIKRVIWSKRNIKGSDAKRGEGYYDEEKSRKCITEIVKAVQDMSKNNVGAIIVLANGNIPKQILDSGVAIESDISSELVESIFFPKTPLHDGAMVIDGTKIVAAGCFLPLAQKIDGLPKDLGTRHRAGLGITETIDVVSLIVSEETGIISIARAGKLIRYADAEILKKTLSNYYWQ